MLKRLSYCRIVSEYITIRWLTHGVLYLTVYRSNIKYVHRKKCGMEDYFSLRREKNSSQLYKILYVIDVTCIFRLWYGTHSDLP